MVARVVGEVAARPPRRAVRRGQHGAVPRLRRGLVLHRSGDERDRRDGDALSTTGDLRRPPTDDDYGCDRWATSGAAPALSFDGVSMVFPDGTHALGETTLRRAPGRVRHRRRPVRLRQEHAAAHRLRARPQPPAARSTSTAASSATSSRTRRCCSGAPCSERRAARRARRHPKAERADARSREHRSSSASPASRTSTRSSCRAA